LSLAKGRESKVYVDIAFNFLSPGVKLLSCALGLEMGDPSITDIACDLTPGVERFLSELKSFDASFNFDAHAVPRHIARLKKNYALQDGFRLAGNEFLKFKKFIYGRRQERFLPARRPMGCSTDILGILASGDVVPCCLAYDTSLSMGNIKEEPLPAILERNRFFIENLRSGKDLPIRCRRCLGAPTKRGLLFKQLKDRVVKTLYEGN
jgi:radical SAM protein with 4Fe4S-binding SPASM domain